MLLSICGTYFRYAADGTRQRNGSPGHCSEHMGEHSSHFGSVWRNIDAPHPDYGRVDLTATVRQLLRCDAHALSTYGDGSGLDACDYRKGKDGEVDADEHVEWPFG